MAEASVARGDIGPTGVDVQTRPDRLHGGPFPRDRVLQALYKQSIHSIASISSFPSSLTTRTQWSITLYTCRVCERRLPRQLGWFLPLISPRRAKENAVSPDSGVAQDSIRLPDVLLPET